MNKSIKIIVVLIAFLCNQHYIYSQNLVVNGSFEEMYICPFLGGQISNAIGWSNPAKGIGYNLQGGVPNPSDGSSPDLYATCSSYPYINFSSNNDFLVLPLDGLNSASIVSLLQDFTHIPQFQNDSCYIREYIQGKLNSELEIGKRYKVSFSVCLHRYQCDQISNKLSLLFTSDSLQEALDLCMYKPQIITNTYFNQIDEWQLFETEYIANGSEQYLSLGLFVPNYSLELIDNPNCDWIYSSPSWGLRYLIDDVKVVCIDPNGCDEISTGGNINTQKLSVFPNPASLQVNLKFSEPFIKALSYTISDLQGRQLLQGSIQNQETVLNISNLSKGIYLLNISDAEGNKWNKKIVKGE